MLLANGQMVPLAPQALAEMVPQMVNGYYYPESVGLQLEREYQWYSTIYRVQPWVRTLVDKRANAVARLGLEVWDEGGGTRTLDRTSPYAKLMVKPCYYLDNFTWLSWISSTVDIFGETFLAIQLDSYGRPWSLMPMHPTRVAIRRDYDTGEYLYTFQAGAGAGDGLVQFSQAEVVPIRLFNPFRTERGLSRLESLRSTIMQEDSSRNAQSAQWRNGGRPMMALSTPRPLGPDGRARLKQSFESMHSGSSNSGQALVLEDGLSAAPLQLTNVEMDYIASRQLNREELCAAYDVAPTMVHILEHATFSNISSQMRAFYRDTMAPHLTFLQSMLDTYVGSYYYGNKTARFAIDEVLRGDFETRAESTRSLIMVGVLTPNEGRELMGMTAHSDPKANKLFMQASIQPIAEPAERITLTGAVGNDPDNVALSAIAAAQLPAAKPAVPAAPQPAKPQQSAAKPQVAPPTAKYLRELKSGMGRGREVRELARLLAKKYPNDLEAIAEAVSLALAERKAA